MVHLQEDPERCIGYCAVLQGYRVGIGHSSSTQEVSTSPRYVSYARPGPSGRLITLLLVKTVIKWQF